MWCCIYVVVLRLSMKTWFVYTYLWRVMWQISYSSILKRNIRVECDVGAFKFLSFTWLLPVTFWYNLSVSQMPASLDSLFLESTENFVASPLHIVGKYFSLWIPYIILKVMILTWSYLHAFVHFIDLWKVHTMTQ